MRYLNPRPTAAALARHYPDDYLCYSNFDREHWLLRWAFRLLQRGQAKRRLRQIEAATGRLSASTRVLDVGCGSGEFVASLPAAIAKAGVEPSVAAAARAMSRGVVILGGSLEQLSPERCFDVITLIDVIEHVPEPAALLQLAARHLNPGGVIIVSTGDPESAAWRWFAARFWYATYPEHVSFPSRRFFELWLADHGGGSLQKLRTRYQRLPVSKWVLYGLIQVGYFLGPSAFHRIGRLIMGGKSKRRFFAPSAPGVFLDHQVVLLPGAIEQEVGLNGAR